MPTEQQTILTELIGVLCERYGGSEQSLNGFFKRAKPHLRNKDIADIEQDASNSVEEHALEDAEMADIEQDASNFEEVHPLVDDRTAVDSPVGSSDVGALNPMETTDGGNGTVGPDNDSTEPSGEGGRHECSLCRTRYRTEYNLRKHEKSARHLRAKSNERQKLLSGSGRRSKETHHPCYVCNKEFTSEEIQLKHLLTHIITQ